MKMRAIVWISRAFVTGAIAIAATSGAASAWAQQKAPLGPQLAGTTWTLVSVYNEQDGKRTEPFGETPKGIFMLDRNGRFIQFFLRAGLPKFASNNRAAGTDDENRAVVRGSNAYYGTYSFDEQQGLLLFRVEGGTFPNWDGTEQKRMAVLAGDELTLTNPLAAVGGKGVSVWRRMK